MAGYKVFQAATEHGISTVLESEEEIDLVILDVREGRLRAKEHCDLVRKKRVDVAVAYLGSELASDQCADAIILREDPETVVRNVANILKLPERRTGLRFKNPS